MFRFRLETLLRMRLAERDQRRAELAKAIRAEEVLRADDSHIEQQQHEQAQRGRTLKSPGQANVDALLQWHRYELVLTARRQQLAAQIAQVQAETERRRQLLVEADRQVRVLEKLRDRQAAADAKQAQKREARALDELAAAGFVRRQEAHA